MGFYYRFFCISFFMFFLCFSCSIEPTDEVVGSMEMELEQKKVKPIELEILELINKHRTDKGFNVLFSRDLIKSVAHSHTDYMINENEVSHHNFFVRSDFLKSRIGAKKVSENVAHGYTSAKAVFSAWLKSKEHKKNLEGDYTYFDISAEQNIEGRWFFTNIFIKL